MVKILWVIFLLKGVLALISGALNGMFGTGGGTVALPMLKKVTNDEKTAFQTVQLFILPLSILSAVTYKKSENIKGIVFICLGALIGGILGAFLSKKIKVKYLKIIFGLIILYVGVKAFL